MSQLGSVARAGLVFALVVLGCWSAACLLVDRPFAVLPSRLLAASVACFALAVPWLGTKGRATAALVFLGVQLWWASLLPSNDRDWQPEVARVPWAQIEGDRVTVHNVRNFAYRSVDDFDARWETRSYDLSRLQHFDLFISHWDSPWIAHTIASWSFEDGEPLAISIETRKEKGETYSAMAGFFRQYELIYVAGDERDLIGLRAEHRGERVYLYRFAIEAEMARSLLLDYLEEINRLRETPRWYNALVHNCTTTMEIHARHVAPTTPFDWRVVVNGLLDELAYDHALLKSKLPFAELRRRSEISERARAAYARPGFSRTIRAGLPGFAP